MSLTRSPAQVIEESDSPLVAAPDSWERVELGSVVRITNGYAFKSSGFSNSSGMPLLRIRDLFSGQTEIRFSGYYDQRYVVSSGDLLVGMDGDFNTAWWTGGSALLNQRVCKLDADPSRLNPEFLAVILPGYLDAIHAATSSTTVTHLSSRDLARAPIPLPSLATQARVVEQVLTARKGSQSVALGLERAKEAMSRLEKSLLLQACTGVLTEDWRSERGLGPWDYEAAGSVCAKVQSGTTPKVWADSTGIPFLKVYNVVNQKLSFDYRPQYISRDLHKGAMARATALPGDVLMNIVGPPLGKVSVVTDEYPEWSINQALTLFRPSERVTTEWLYLYLCSGLPVAQVANDTRGSVGQVNISLSQCRAMSFAIPTLPEQRVIADRVAAVLEKRSLIVEAIRSAERAIQALGNSAFVRAMQDA